MDSTMNKQEKQEQERFDKLYKRWGKQKARKAGIKFMTTAENQEKISDNIRKYADPLFAEFFDYNNDFESIFDAAILLWNFSLRQYLSPDEKLRVEYESEFIYAFATEPFLLDPDETMNLVQAMEKHWLENFSHDLRMVVDRKIFEGEQGFHFSVIAHEMSPSAEETAND